MGKKPNAPVVSIGAVFFDPQSGEIGPEFYTAVSLESAMEHNGIPTCYEQLLLARLLASAHYSLSNHPETEKSQSVYLLRHHSKVKKTTLEQKLTVKNDAFGRFKPFVELEDFPEGLSEREAMLKLADWLHRLSVAIEDNWSTP
ncbi:hypothetical protein GFK21_21410 [Salmonella enterica subsp. enterica serovar Enteritidis]|nr:hypothetical protein [Salmonella enterica subsp. enterica serovar Enteritidis]